MNICSEIIANISEGINLVRASDNVIVYTNQKFDEMFGYASGELLGKHISVVNAPAGIRPKESEAGIRASLTKNGMWQGEMINLKRNGTPFLCSASISSFEHSLYGKVFLWVHADITEYKNKQKKIIDQINYLQKPSERYLRIESKTDELTGLLNRRGFLAVAQKQCFIANRNNLNLYCLFINLDGLKEINDKHGHQAGDEALIDTARLLENFRSSDIIARIGADEFAVISVESPEINIEMLTRRLKDNLAIFNSKSNKPYKLSFSMGLAHYKTGQPCSVDELLSEAEKR